MCPKFAKMCPKITKQLVERIVSGIWPFLYYLPRPPFFLQLMTVKVMVHVWKETYSGGGIAI